MTVDFASLLVVFNLLSLKENFKLFRCFTGTFTKSVKKKQQIMNAHNKLFSSSRFSGPFNVCEWVSHSKMHFFSLCVSVRSSAFFMDMEICKTARCCFEVVIIVVRSGFQNNALYC